MSIKKTDLSWLSVTNLEKALHFYKETLGFKELSVSKEHGWAELQGADGGAVVGLAVKGEDNPIQPGANACITLTVDSIESEIVRLKERKVRLVGTIQTVPGHVKMQLLQDLDGNYLQLVEVL